MELYEMKQSLSKNQNKLKSMGISLDLDSKRKQIEENNQKMQEADFWNDQKAAQKLIKNNNQMKQLVDSYDELTEILSDLNDSVNELSSTFDEDMNELVQEEFLEASKKFEEFEIQVLLSGPYDNHNAILEIHPGAGGTESQDWALMLFRMYQRYAQKNGYGFEVIDYEDGDEAGLKSCSVLIKGDLAYGYL